MKNILWYQPANLKDADVIACNGEVINDNLMRSLLFKELKSVASNVMRFERPWCGNVDGHYFVKGSFDAMDERGRTLSFTYMSDMLDNKDGLIKDVKTLGFTLDKKTQDCISKTSRYITYKVIGCVFIILVVLFIIIYL